VEYAAPILQEVVVCLHNTVYLRKSLCLIGLAPTECLPPQATQSQLILSRRHLRLQQSALSARLFRHWHSSRLEDVADRPLQRISLLPPFHARVDFAGGRGVLSATPNLHSATGCHTVLSHPIFEILGKYTSCDPSGVYTFEEAFSRMIQGEYISLQSFIQSELLVKEEETSQLLDDCQNSILDIHSKAHTSCKARLARLPCSAILEQPSQKQ